MSAATATYRDFPDWLGPMIVKELRQGLKARAFVLSFIGLQAVFVLALIYQALFYSKHPDKFNASGLNEVFWTLVGIQLMILTPFRAFTALSGERRANTLELLFMTGLTPWRITFGKWLSLFFQAVLFLLAVLPYGILRYFFGGINLADDLAVLVSLLASSAIVTAVFIALSGLPLFVRVAAIVLSVLLVTGALPALILSFSLRSSMSGSMVGLPSFAIGNHEWPLLLWNAIILTLAALEVGAATIAPPAENHALRQRLITFLLLVPIPIMMALHVDQDRTGVQLLLFAVLAFFTAWHNLAAPPTILRCHNERFLKFGRAGFLVAGFLQPGPAGAALFLFLVECALVSISRPLFPNRGDWKEFAAFVLIGGANLLTAPTLWALIRRRSRWQLVEFFLFSVVCSCAGLFILNLKRDESHFGTTPISAIFPPIGSFLMQDSGTSKWGEIWCIPSAAAFLCYFALLLLLFRDFWRQIYAFYANRRTNAAAAPALTTA